MIKTLVLNRESKAFTRLITRMKSVNSVSFAQYCVGGCG